MPLKYAAGAVVALIIAASAAFVGWSRYHTASSQNPAYQSLVAALQAGSIVHFSDTVYRPNAVPLAQRDPHMLPDSYTADLWLQYSGDKVAMQCSLVRDTHATFLQSSKYDPSSSVVLTTYADGKQETNKPPNYSTPAQILAGFATEPDASVAPNPAAVVSAATQNATASIAVVQTRVPSGTRTNYYDPVTGEFSGADEKDASGTRVYSLRRTVEVLSMPSIELQECPR